MENSNNLHEAPDRLRPETVELHRAIASLMEELEAVDWYNQRADACGDEALRQVLVHNRDEEKEHACMTLEWIRRHDPVFEGMLRRYLFREGSIVEREAEDAAEGPRFAPTLGLGSLAEAAR
jgi:ferritin-like protein